MRDVLAWGSMRTQFSRDVQTFAVVAQALVILTDGVATKELVEMVNWQQLKATERLVLASHLDTSEVRADDVESAAAQLSALITTHHAKDSATIRLAADLSAAAEAGEVACVRTLDTVLGALLAGLPTRTLNTDVSLAGRVGAAVDDCWTGSWSEVPIGSHRPISSGRPRRLRA